MKTRKEGTDPSLHRTVTTWAEFRQRWDGVLNFLMAGECVPFEFALPSLDRIVDEMRREPQARITPGKKGSKLDMTDMREQFLKLPIEEALRSSFALAHFRLSAFDAPGKFLHGFKTQVLDRWQEALRAQGFTWTRCYPIIFISGAGCATNYHMDFSHVLAWQRYGTKRFCGLKDPTRWASREMRVDYRADSVSMPADLKPEDGLCYEMKPGDVLWNAFLTPHWVEASNEVAMSFNISHGGLRGNGQLCPHEQEVEDFRRAHPDRAPAAVQGTY